MIRGNFHSEIREVADAAYDQVEWQCAYAEQPFAVFDIAGEHFPTIRELVPLFTVVGETKPQFRKDSVMWNENTSLMSRFLKNMREDGETISNSQAEYMADLFLRGKGEYIEGMSDGMPDGSICLLGMMAIYTFTQYRGTNPDTGEPMTFMELFTDDSIKRVTYSPFEEISAKLIAPRAFVAKVIDATPSLEELDQTFSQPNEKCNAAPAELIVLASLPHVLAGDQDIHPRIKEALFT